MIRVIVWVTINLVFWQELRDPAYAKWNWKAAGSWEEVGHHLADENEDGGVNFALDGLRSALLWVSPLGLLTALVMGWSLIAAVPLVIVLAGEFGALAAVAMRKFRVGFCGASSGVGLLDEVWALLFTSSFVAITVHGWFKV